MTRPLPALPALAESDAKHAEDEHKTRAENVPSKDLLRSVLVSLHDVCRAVTFLVERHERPDAEQSEQLCKEDRQAKSVEQVFSNGLQKACLNGDAIILKDAHCTPLLRRGLSGLSDCREMSPKDLQERRLWRQLTTGSQSKPSDANNGFSDPSSPAKLHERRDWRHLTNISQFDAHKGSAAPEDQHGEACLVPKTEWCLEDESELCEAWGKLSQCRHLQSQREAAVDGDSDSGKSHESIFIHDSTTVRQAWAIHPASNQRLVWDTIGAFMVTYDIIVLPLIFFPIHDQTIMQCIDWFGCIFWTLDIVMSFRTGFLIGVRVEMRPKLIAQHYAKRSLILDVSIVAIDWSTRMTNMIGGLNVLRVFRLNRLLRSSRLVRTTVKAFEFLRVLQHVFHSKWKLMTFEIIKRGILLIVVIHYFACGWYFVGIHTKNSWITTAEETIGEQSSFFWYVDATCWTLAQLNGRTDEALTTNMVQLVYIAFLGIFRLLFISWLMGSIATKMMELHRYVADRKASELVLNQFLNHHRLPRLTVFMAWKHIEHTHAIQNTTVEEVLKILPFKLQLDVVFEVRGAALAKHPLFGRILSLDKGAIRGICLRAMTTMACSNHHVVFEKGDICTEMLIVESGELIYSEHGSIKDEMQTLLTFDEVHAKFDKSMRLVHMVPDNLLRPKQVKPGHWISELAVFVEWLNQGELLATLDSTFFVLDADRLMVLLEDFEMARNTCRLHAWCLARTVGQQDIPSDVMDFGESVVPTWDDIDNEIKRAPVQHAVLTVKPTTPAANVPNAGTKLQITKAKTKLGDMCSSPEELQIVSRSDLRRSSPDSNHSNSVISRI